MGLHRWWDGDPLERYWLEITGRLDLGRDLHAPKFDDGHRENPTYSLVREVEDGDIVLHYEKRERAITSWSVAEGGFWEADTYWGTPRSTGRSGAPVDPYRREGLWHGLRGPYLLPRPVTLEELRARQSVIASVREGLINEHRKPLYFPFQVRSDGIRAAQGYLTKMPAALIDALPELPDLIEVLPTSELPGSPPAGEAGEPYVDSPPPPPQIERDPFTVDPSVVERALASHGELQNRLAHFLEDSGLKPRRPGPLDPQWDLLWLNGEETWVAEVKSLTRDNEERQLRLGLGQLMIYRQRLLRHHASVRPVLMVEWKPLDPDWHELCARLGILLLWPAVISEKALDVAR